MNQLEISGQVRELARNVEFKSRTNDRWEFVISPALRHLGSQNCIDRLGAAISARVGQPVHIQIVDEEQTEMVTAAALEEQRSRQNMSEAARSIREDPTVKSLQEQMGASVVDDSIQPLQ